MEKWLYVDDLRTPDYRAQFIARSLSQAISYLNVISFDVIDLDYYLGDGTGMDVLRFIMEKNIKCQKIIIHSDSIDGRLEMKKYIQENIPDTEIVLS